jgi:hypothetical protein
MSALAVSLFHPAPPAERPNLLPEAHRSLRRELIRALHEDPARVVATPAFGRVNTAADVVLDEFSGANGDQSLHQLLRIVGRAARGEVVHLEAAAWIAATAERHALWHRDDLVHVMEGGEQ